MYLPIRDNKKWKTDAESVFTLKTPYPYIILFYFKEDFVAEQCYPAHCTIFPSTTIRNLSVFHFRFPKNLSPPTFKLYGSITFTAHSRNFSKHRTWQPTLPQPQSPIISLPWLMQYAKHRPVLNIQEYNDGLGFPPATDDTPDTSIATLRESF